MTSLAPDEIYYDVFLSHGSSDKEWIRLLSTELQTQGLRVFVDDAGIQLGENFVLTIDNALRDSRFLVVVLSRASSERPWVIHEWTTFKAKKGPLGRVIPVLLEAVELPIGLLATQAIDAIDRDFRRVALELVRSVGRPGELAVDDPRLSAIGQELTFVLKPVGEAVEIITPDDRSRRVHAPWRVDRQFSHALQLFHVLAHQPIQNREGWQAIYDYAQTVGRALYDILFDGASAELLQRAFRSGRTPPALTLLSTDDPVLALPWELLHDGTRFLVSEGGLDLMRSTIDGSFSQMLGSPTQHFKLLVNVSVPQGCELNYEEESYRISKVLSARCDMILCELGTLDDLVMTAARFAPLGIHFSGHGSPGTLVFETDENEADQVPIDRLVTRLRTETPTGLPQFFYLASCHGNTPTQNPGGRDAEVSAARLHREGVAEVIGYFGPIVEHLSTQAEEALYSAINVGRTTRFAVRQARLTLATSFGSTGGKPGAAPEYTGELAFPFAWSQLVFYRRGPEHPLTLPDTSSRDQQPEIPLQRTFQDAGNRRILISGFIGRRTELHAIRRRLRRGQRVFVFQGLGGLGKTTLAVHLLSWLAKPDEVCVVWCQELANETDPACALVERLIDYGYQRFGADFEELVAQLDQKVGDGSLRRCRAVIDILVARVPNLIIYLDNLESLLVGPDNHDHAAGFAEWRSEDLLGVWRVLLDYAENTSQLRLLASSRYFNSSIPSKYQFPLAPLNRDAIFRLTKWFPALLRLSWRTRSRLAERLAGHPRAVELADALVDHALEQWESVRGHWRTPDSSNEKAVVAEWEELVKPALPDVQERLESNLLLDAIWDRVLTDRARRMLYRMSLMRSADRWSWYFVRFLGDEDIPTAEDEAIVSLLLRTSLLVVFDEHAHWMPAGVTERFYGLHPSTLEYVRRRFVDDAKLKRETHYRVGCVIMANMELDEDEFTQNPDYEIFMASEASYHFLQSGHYSLAATAGGEAAANILRRGRGRQVLQLLQPFLEPSVLSALAPPSLCKVLDYMGRGCRELGMFEQAVKYHEKALEAARNTDDEVVTLGNLANLYLKMEQYDRALPLMEKAMELARAKNSRKDQVVQLINLGGVYVGLGKIEQALTYLEQASKISSEIGNFNAEDCAVNMGSVYARLGQYEKAVEYFERAAHLAQERDKPLTQEKAFHHIGVIHLEAGRMEKAIMFFDHALQVARKIGDRELEAQNLTNLAQATFKAEEFARSIDYSMQAIRLARKTGDQQVEVQALFMVAMINYKLAQWQKAIDYFEQALTVARELGDTEKGLICLGMIGDSWGELNRSDEQIRAYEAAVAMAHSSSFTGKEHHYLAQLGEAYYNLGQFDRATEFYESALAVLDQCVEQTPRADYYNNLGTVYAKLGKIDQALASFEQAAQGYRQAGNRPRERALLHSAGSLCMGSDRHDQGVAFFQRILEIDRQTGELRQELETLRILGLVHAELGAWESAMNYLCQAVEVSRELSDEKAERELLVALSFGYGELAFPDKEIQCREKLLSMAREAGDRPEQAAVLGRLGRLHIGAGQHEKAIVYLKESILIWEEIGDENRMLSPLINLGGTLFNLNQPQKAIEYLGRAVQVAHKIGDRRAEGQALANLGIAQDGLGKREAAVDSLKKAILIGQEIGDAQLVQFSSQNLNSLGSSESP